MDDIIDDGQKLMDDFLEYSNEIFIGNKAKIISINWENKIVFDVSVNQSYMSYGIERINSNETEIYLNIWSQRYPDDYANSEKNIESKEIFTENHENYLRRRFGFEKIFTIIDGKLFWNDEFIPNNILQIPRKHKST